MTHTIHIDENWFYITKDSETYYLVPDEPDVYRDVQSKRFITKVMFMSAVCKPMYNEDGSILFDGKIGIFPFTFEKPAARSSKKGPKGTIETQVITSVTKDVVKDCLINKILLAIKAKWPAIASKHIKIQQDNARPHFNNEDVDFRAAASADGFNIQLVNQPPNSPYMNVNDLGFFRSLQSLQSRAPSRSVITLMQAVMNAFEEYGHEKLNFIWLSLQNVMIEVLKRMGHNDFRLPHMGKGAILRQGLLPTNLLVDEALVLDSLDYLVQLKKHAGLEQLMEDLGYQLEDIA